MQVSTNFLTSPSREARTRNVVYLHIWSFPIERVRIDTYNVIRYIGPIG